MQSNTIKSKCATCGIRMRAEQNPTAFMSRLWKWHTGWCPGWKAYQKELAAQGNASPKA